MKRFNQLLSVSGILGIILMIMILSQYGKFKTFSEEYTVAKTRAEVYYYELDSNKKIQDLESLYKYMPPKGKRTLSDYKDLYDTFNPVLENGETLKIPLGSEGTAKLPQQALGIIFLWFWMAIFMCFLSEETFFSTEGTWKSKVQVFWLNLCRTCLVANVVMVGNLISFENDLKNYEIFKKPAIESLKSDSDVRTYFSSSK